MNLKELQKYLGDQSNPFLVRANTLIKENLTLGARVMLGEFFLKAVTAEERNCFKGKISEIESLMKSWRSKIDPDKN